MSRLGRGFPNNAILRPPPLVPVTYDTVGTGAGANALTLSWTETVNPGDSVLVFGTISTQASITAVGDVNGTAMTSLVAPLICYISSPNRLYLYVLGLLNAPAASSQDINVTLSGGSAVYYHQASSVAFSRVSSFGAPVTNTGAAGAASVSASAPINGRVVAAMAQNATGSTTFTSLSGGWTSRWNPAPNSVYSSARSLLIGDSPGGAVTLGATASGAWGAIAIPLR